MEQKTKVNAEDGRQELRITRQFDLPLHLLFRAYAEAEIVEQWMGTRVLKLENKKHGSYQFETTDAKGNKYGFNGAIHEFVQDSKITRTFEMEKTPYGIQLEFLDFQSVTDDTSRLDIHIVYRSVEHRDAMLKLGMGQGMNMAHNRLQLAAGKLNK